MVQMMEVRLNCFGGWYSVLSEASHCTRVRPYSWCTRESPMVLVLWCWLCSVAFFRRLFRCLSFLGLVSRAEMDEERRLKRGEEGWKVGGGVVQRECGGQEKVKVSGGG
jgi:hypothetical protein